MSSLFSKATTPAFSLRKTSDQVEDPVELLEWREEYQADRQVLFGASRGVKNRNAIEDLNRRYGVTRAAFFSQRRFRQQQHIAVPAGLCAALVQVWWEHSRDGGDGLSPLDAPSPALIREILQRQARSTYLRELPNGPARLSPADQALLQLKYGTADLYRIRTLLAQYGATSPLELDLILDHGAPIAERHAFADDSGALEGVMTAAGSPGLRLLLLRYTKAMPDARESGHRMAFQVDSKGQYRFFDPNWGEVQFERGADFREWFAGYWEAAGYRQRIRHPVPADAPIRLYRFAPPLTLPELEETSGRES